MTNKGLVLKKLNDLDKYVTKLGELKRYSLRELENDLEKIWAVEHGLQLAIQVIIDVGHHILADMGESGIEDYADVIDKLGKRNIIPAEFAKDIRGMTGLRNVLVQDYVNVDLKKVYNVLQGRLEDFKWFAKYINRYLAKE